MKTEAWGINEVDNVQMKGNTNRSDVRGMHMLHQIDKMSQEKMSTCAQSICKSYSNILSMEVY